MPKKTNGIPSKQFVNDCDCSQEGFRLVRDHVGNSQKNDPKAMEEALQRSMRHGYITITPFMYHSGLKYKSAKNFLDSLCTGDHPRLKRYREGRVWHYTLLETSPTV